jgi:DNA-binding IclR family transcriptional regulator
MEEKQTETRSSIQVIDRMMNLLDALAAQSAPANLKLLALATQLHPSTAHRILNVMVRNRMVDRVEPGTYCLGMRLLEFGTLVRARADAGASKVALGHSIPVEA